MGFRTLPAVVENTTASKRSEVDEFAVRALETQREGVFSAAVYENIRLDQREIELIDSKGEFRCRGCGRKGREIGNGSGGA